MYKARTISVFVILLGLISIPNFGYGQAEQITIEKSDTVIDGNGGIFNGGKLTYLVINSVKTAAGWIQTKNVTIKNCTIKGGVRIIGLGKNGQAAGVKESSLSLGHTERAQAAAPTNITFSNVTFETSDGMTSLYIAPGTTYVTVENSAFTGTNTGSGPVVYMDAESGHNVFRNNTFNATASREVIACDGSAYNLIESNRFEKITKGGIYLYRNCGEGGTIRHQTPNHNTIKNNTFNLSNLVLGNYGIWLGSRNGNRTYCDDDAGYSFGSSINNNDFADHNIVNGNIFTGGYGIGEIKNNGSNNQINVPTAVSQIEAADSLCIRFLNNRIMLNNQNDHSILKVFDGLGRVIINEQVSRNNASDFPLYAKGLCFVQLSFNNRIFTKKIVAK